MRRLIAAVAVLIALTLVPALAPGQAKPASGVKGTVLDATCGAACQPGEVDFPRYEGEAASVLVRRAGTSKVLGRVQVAAGRFTAHLAPGRYVLRAHVAERCWSGTRQVVEIEARRWIPVVLKVADVCVV